MHGIQHLEWKVSLGWTDGRKGASRLAYLADGERSLPHFWLAGAGLDALTGLVVPADVLPGFVVEVSHGAG